MKKRIFSIIVSMLIVISPIFTNNPVPVFAGGGVDLTGTAGWVSVIPANNQFDYIGDQQTGSGSVSQDIVGDSNHPAFYVKYDELAGEIGFRIRINSADGNSDNEFKNFAFVGVDADRSGSIDFFIGVYAPNGNGRLGIYNADPVKLNITKHNRNNQSGCKTVSACS